MQFSVKSALVAKAVGRPVKLIWTREEDIAQGMFRPQSFQCVEAATDAGGKVVGWQHCVVGDGEFLLQTGIRIPYYGVHKVWVAVDGGLIVQPEQARHNVESAIGPRDWARSATRLSRRPSPTRCSA